MQRSSCLRRLAAAAVAIAVMLIPARSEAQNLIVGSAIWRITFQLDGRDHTVDFRATTDGKVLTQPAKKKKALPTTIGTWKGDAKKTTVRVTEGNPHYQGTYVVSQQRESDTPTWTGTFTDTTGQDRPVTILLLKD